MPATKKGRDWKRLGTPDLNKVVGWLGDQSGRQNAFNRSRRDDLLITEGSISCVMKRWYIFHLTTVLRVMFYVRKKYQNWEIFAAEIVTIFINVSHAGTK